MRSFQRLVAQIASGTIGSQTIILLSTPALTRLLGPTSFGELAIFSSIYAILAGVFTLKYEQSILLAKNDNVASSLTALTAQLSFAASLTLSLATIPFVLIKDLPFYWLALPLCTFLAALHTSAQQWAARRRDYRVYSFSLILGASINTSACLIAAIAYGDSPLVLIAAFTLGLIVSTGYTLTHQKIGFSRVTTITREHWHRHVALIKLYRNFPMHVLPTSLAIGATNYAPPLILASAYSLTITGQYAIAAKFVLLPSVLLGGAISEAFRAEFMALVRNQAPISNLTRNFLLRTFIVSLPVFALITLLAPWAFTFAFGPAYEHTGTLVRYLALGAAGMLLSAPVQCIFVGLGKSRLGLLYQLTHSALPLLALYLAALALPVEYAIFLHSITVFFLSALIATAAYVLSIKSDRASCN